MQERTEQHSEDDARRVPLGSLFLEHDDARGTRTFGRGDQWLVTGLSVEQAFGVLVRVTERAGRSLDEGANGCNDK